MNEQLRLFLEDIQSDILIALGEHTDAQRERFFSELADWAYSRYEYTLRIL